MAQYGLVVIGAMEMCEEIIRINGPQVVALSGRGVPVPLMGPGVLKYFDVVSLWRGRSYEEIT